MHDLLEIQQDHVVNAAPVITDHQSILDRLSRIEAALGIAEDQVTLSREASPEEDTEDVSLRGVWKALAHLRVISRPPPDESVWSRRVVKQLWTSFINDLPLLHFLKDHGAFTSPTPVLLASVLYISALHHPPAGLSSLNSGYFTAICCAIAELATPRLHRRSLYAEKKTDEEQNAPTPQLKREDAFHDILGLIMACLGSEAYIETTGSWIAMAYRIWLDYLPTEMNSTTLDWRGLFSGLQVIDIEHASMHMSYPLLPRHAPAPGIQRLDSHQGHAFQGLAEMMHFGLSHFVGRGLPSIWSSINASEADTVPATCSPFTENDSRVIRHWARKLDDWLVRYNGASQPTPSDRKGILILLQYHLHKLYVLSIYHPARGFELSPANISTFERHELLVSARAVLRLRQDDASIWSNWDLVMITWAAVLLLQGVEDGITHQHGKANSNPKGQRNELLLMSNLDLHLIQTHLQSLERRSQSATSIHAVLSHHLESNMEAMHTPPDTSLALAFPGPRADDSWTIFDQEIMSLANPPWLFEESMQLPQIQKSSAVHQLQAGLPPVQYDSVMLEQPSQHFAANTQ
ncbi:hypothetical protein N7457_003322 [Penicillium paradoxum]|uniref:uncharacterized protein n=1 Tax=Penicillium paradoxum TaxID=176176 RepID=UPI0025489EAB|nr:uncharacterized protein N7457_003322 [Penicillium paradoxum]KAJ5788332.1 hypothetical protein N7457_003322 [Penicillium paradoxum]